MKNIWNFVFFVLVVLGSPVLYAAYENENTAPTLELGAKVFSSHCVLCHGSQAMGEGILPLKMKVYPSTNLRTAKKAAKREEILHVNVLGGVLDNISQYMPPFGKELTWSELESVTDFILLVRSDPETAIAMLEVSSQTAMPSIKIGQQVYTTRCTLCHGKFGEGDGRMSKILKTPPPADLTASKAPDEYLGAIISKGGEAVGRSKHMPPWGDQLSKSEIKSVILYIKSIRD